MSIVFISHSKRDEELVRTIKKILENIGHTPIIEEYIPREKQAKIPYEEIRNNVQQSDFAFVFLTDNIVATEYTKNWVMYEISVASAHRKKVFVFERLGVPIPYPIPYVTDYTLFNPDDTNDILEVQALARKLGEMGGDIKAALALGAIGTLFGPVGTIVGALAGYMLSPKPKEPKETCPNCNVAFNYYSRQIKNFSCPCCRQPMSVR